MPSEKEIRQALDSLFLPTLGRSLGSLNVVRSVKCNEHCVSLELAATALNDLAQRILQVQINKELKNLPGIEQVEVAYVECKPAVLNEVKHVIAVMSGKGGVGKSLVSGLLAIGLKRKGYSVGILDADITGPSIPKMFGLKEKPIGCKEGFFPVLTASGIAVMSLNLILDNEDDAVIWRGPLISKTITQFWEEGFWGKLDYMIVDLPPGTADAPLTVIQSLPVSGLVIVSTPQELASMIVKKAINMASSTKSRILGVVENMSYLYLADIDRKVEVFGSSHGEELAAAAGAPLLALIPIDPTLAGLCDAGRVEDCQLDVIDRLAVVSDL
jgi:Mrp family chromosome partitioning ATPase